MAKSLVDFLEELDSNAKLKQQYQNDPVGTANDYGLSDEDVKLIENKDWETIKKRFENLGRDSKVHTY